MKVIGVVGSRSRDSDKDYECIIEVFEKIYSPGDKICSGGCPKGGDRFAEMIAKNKGIEIIIFRADWNKYGKQAGFIRNTDVAKTSTHLIACVSENRKGGTEDTIKKFVKIHGEQNLHIV